MNAKKIATTMGTGTLGAGGAGAAAWNFGLFGGNGLGVNVDNAAGKQLNGVTPSSPDAHQVGVGQEISAGNQGNEGRGSQAQSGTSAGRGGGDTIGSEMLYFDGETERDKKAINSSLEQDWSSTVSVSGGISVAIKNGKDNDTSNLWICRLEAIILESSNISDSSEFKRQGEELVGKIKANDDQRKKFVENCSKARTDSEKKDEARSKIYLETEKVDNKFKFKDRDIENLLTKDFGGVYKLGDDEENVLSSMVWEKKEEKVGEDQKKVTFDAKFNDDEGQSSNWSCSFSGSPKIEKTFKDDKLEKILNTFGSIPSENAEKKKYILRNCMKNNKDIKGLKFKEEGDNFMLEEESLKKITEGMYENPANT